MTGYRDLRLIARFRIVGGQLVPETRAMRAADRHRANQLRWRDRRTQRRDKRHPFVPPMMAWYVGWPGGSSEWPPPYGRAHRRATRP